jgi:hypothetical protein
MNTSTNDLEKRLAQLKRKVPTRGLERHPSIFRNISDLPAELQSPTVSSIAASEDIQDIISFPQQIHRGHHYVPKQALLFTSTDIIHVVASIWPDQEPEVTYLRGRGLLYIKVTLILLYGYLEIVAQGNTSPARLGVEFNTVAWEQLSRPVRKLLQAAIGAPVTTTGKIIFSQTAQVAVDRLPLKFFNGIRIYGVLPGEELENLVFQPGTWERWLHFFQRPSLANTFTTYAKRLTFEKKAGNVPAWNRQNDK